MIIKYKRQPETTLPIQSTLLIQSPFAAVYPVAIQYTKKGRLFTFPLSIFFLWFPRIYIKTKTISFLLGPSVNTSIYSQFFFALSVYKKNSGSYFRNKNINISPPLFLVLLPQQARYFPQTALFFLSQLWWCLLPHSLFIFFLCHPWFYPPFGDHQQLMIVIKEKK